MKGIVQAKRDFVTNGRVIHRGETFREGHPIAAAYPDKFEELTVDNELETATAEPGKKRAKATA